MKHREEDMPPDDLLGSRRSFSRADVGKGLYPFVLSFTGL